MIDRDVQDRRRPGMEPIDRLQLETGHFNREVLIRIRLPCFFARRVVQAASLSAVPRFPPTNARLPCSASIFPISVTVVLFHSSPSRQGSAPREIRGQLKLADDLNAPSSDVLECFHAVGHTGTNDDEIGAVERTFVLGADRHLDGTRSTVRRTVANSTSSFRSATVTRAPAS